MSRYDQMQGKGRCAMRAAVVSYSARRDLRVRPVLWTSVVLQFGGAGRMQHGTFGSAHLCLAHRSGPIAECLVGIRAVGSFSCMCMSSPPVLNCAFYPTIDLAQTNRRARQTARVADVHWSCRFCSLSRHWYMNNAQQTQFCMRSHVSRCAKSDAIWWGTSTGNLPMDLGS
jgi:hypothetical protein